MLHWNSHSLWRQYINSAIFLLCGNGQIVLSNTFQGFIGHYYPTKPANMPNHFMNLVIETFGTSEVENGLNERTSKTSI